MQDQGSRLASLGTGYIDTTCWPEHHADSYVRTELLFCRGTRRCSSSRWVWSQVSALAPASSTQAGCSPHTWQGAAGPSQPEASKCQPPWSLPEVQLWALILCGMSSAHQLDMTASLISTTRFLQESAFRGFLQGGPCTWRGLALLLLLRACVVLRPPRAESCLSSVLVCFLLSWWDEQCHLLSCSHFQHLELLGWATAVPLSTLRPAPAPAPHSCTA